MRSFYAIITDRGYVGRSLCLFRSLQPWLGNKRFGFFCVDDGAAELLERLALPGATVIRHAEFADAELTRVKPSRSMAEYCWTCKPAVLEYALATWPELDWAIYLDGDMMAFADPDVAFEVPEAHVLLTPHRFAGDYFRAFERAAGQFNAGIVGFRNSPEGRRALAWWKASCIAQCSSVPSDDNYADQAYLQQMPERFPGVVASRHRGLNVAPWNLEGCRIELEDGGVHCDDAPLLIYHFQGMRLYGLRLCDLYGGAYRLPEAAIRLIYRPHIKALAAATREVQAIDPDFSGGVQPFLGAPRTIYHQIRRALRGTNNLALVLE